MDLKTTSDMLSLEKQIQKQITWQRYNMYDDCWGHCVKENGIFYVHNPGTFIYLVFMEPFC